MTKLLEQAIERVRRLPEDRQDAIARAILAQADSPGGAPAGGDAEERRRRARQFVESLKTLADQATPPPADWKFDRSEAYDERLGRWG